MKNLLLTITTAGIMLLNTGCALSDEMAANYKRNVANYNEQAPKREAATEKYKEILKSELIDMYGKERGYRILKIVLSDEDNIKYKFNGIKYTPYIEDAVIANAIERTEPTEPKVFYREVTN